jgi:hypothetical protein
VELHQTVIVPEYSGTSYGACRAEFNVVGVEVGNGGSTGSAAARILATSLDFQIS